jgi:hypothetical protein
MPKTPARKKKTAKSKTSDPKKLKKRKAVQKSLPVDEEEEDNGLGWDDSFIEIPDLDSDPEDEEESSEESEESDEEEPEEPSSPKTPEVKNLECLGKMMKVDLTTKRGPLGLKSRCKVVAGLIQISSMGMANATEKAKRGHAAAKDVLKPVPEEALSRDYNLETGGVIPTDTNNSVRLRIGANVGRVTLKHELATCDNCYWCGECNAEAVVAAIAESHSVDSIKKGGLCFDDYVKSKIQPLDFGEELCGRCGPLHKGKSLAFPPFWQHTQVSQMRGSPGHRERLPACGMHEMWSCL